MGAQIYEFFRDQGSIIAGLLALVAGYLAYQAGRAQAAATREAAKGQLKAADLRRDLEIETIRRSVAVELRQILPRALGAHRSLKILIEKRGIISSRMIESSVVIPDPIVYRAIADKISVLGNEAMDVVIVYNLIDIARIYANQLTRYRTPDDVSVSVVAMVAGALLGAPAYGCHLLTRLRTGLAEHDSADADFVTEVQQAESAWRAQPAR